MRIDNGTGSNGVPPIANTPLLAGPPPQNGEMAPNAAPNPIEAHIPTLNDIDHQIQGIQNTIQNYSEDRQQTLINQIQELPEEHIEPLTNTFLRVQKELPLEVLHAFVSQLKYIDKNLWITELRKSFRFWSELMNRIYDVILPPIYPEVDDYVRMPVVKNVINMYLLLFRCNDIGFFNVLEEVRSPPSVKKILKESVSLQITAIQEKFPSYNTQSSRNTYPPLAHPHLPNQERNEH